ANSSSTSLTSSPNPSSVGQTVTFTASVTSAGTRATGTVIFDDGAISIGTGTLNAGGVATFSTSSLTVGAHSITAHYQGDSNYSTSASGIDTQVVNNGNVTTSLTSTPNPSSLSQPVAFTITVTGGATT